MAAAFDDGPEPGALRGSPFPPWTPAVRWLAIAISVAFLIEFGLYLARESMFDSAFWWVIMHLSVVPEQWFTAPPYAPLWQLLTHGFLHDAQTLMHVLGNLLLLYFFGSSLEARLGTRRFLLTYFAGLLSGAVVHLAVAHAGLDLGPAYGASGAVTAVVIALATLAPNEVVYWLFIPLRMKWLALGILAFDIFGALLDLKDGPGGVAHFVHLGGAAYGFVAVRTGLIRKDPIEILERRRAVAHVERAASDAQRVDQLLEKIAREGIGSLSRGERDFLKRASTRK